MNLTILLCLLSLAFFSTQSLSAPSLAPSSSKAPVEAVCDIFKEQFGDKGYEFCIHVFDSYPTIRSATSKGVAMIAMNIAKQELNTFIISIETYLSMYSPNEQKHLGTCLNFLKSDVNRSLQDALHLIRKGQYHSTVKEGEAIMDTFHSTCMFHPIPPQILPSYKKFLVADGVAYIATAFISGMQF